MSVDTGTTLPAVVVAAVREGRRLTDAEVRSVAASHDILALGALADDLRRARHGAATGYVRVHVLPLASRDAWTAPPDTAAEVRITGAPSDATALVPAVRAARALAGTKAVRGFELADLWALGGAALLAELAAAGLNEVATVEPGPDAPAQVMAARAAGLGVRVVGCGAPVTDRASWLLVARALVDAVGGIEAVAPLPREVDVTTPTTGFDDVRAVALTRLALEGVPHVQVDWQRHGPKLAQVALTVGADDLDLVRADDDTSKGLRRAPLEEVTRNITAAALVPVERTATFGRVSA
ncbi:MAG: hypothetical protein U0P30_02850 [Vicinamibacterales bacterium]